MYKIIIYKRSLGVIMTNKEFDYTLKTKKHFLSEFSFPKINTKGENDLIDMQKNKYIFDFQFGSAGKLVITLLAIEAKQKWQIRNGTLPLVRVDVNSSPHMCENGELWKNHIHVFYPDGTKVYKLEDYDKILYKSLNPKDVILDFFKQCNVEIGNLSFQEEL